MAEAGEEEETPRIAETKQNTGGTHKLFYAFLEESSIHGLQKLHESQSKFFRILYGKKTY